MLHHTSFISVLAVLLLLAHSGIKYHDNYYMAPNFHGRKILHKLNPYLKKLNFSDKELVSVLQKLTEKFT